MISVSLFKYSCCPSYLNILMAAADSLYVMFPCAHHSQRVCDIFVHSEFQLYMYILKYAARSDV